ncbi:MAG: hypothetical protein GX222_07855 [Ruminococcaceae bacterium]|nr:hypothetical protein [Oscillospiraceae bacterium]
MSFNIPAITQQEIDADKLEGLPDIPGYSTVDMQKAMDKLATMVAQKVNGLINALGQPSTGVLTEDEVAYAILQAQFASGTGDMLAAMYDPTSKEQDVFAYADNAVSTAVAPIQAAIALAQAEANIKIRRSTAEQVVGIGTNGKPLYHKTFTNISVPAWSSGNPPVSVTVAHGISNPEKFKLVNGTFRGAGDIASQPFPRLYISPTGGSIDLYIQSFNSTNFFINSIYHRAAVIDELTLEYQKSTD